MKLVETPMLIAGMEVLQPFMLLQSLLIKEEYFEPMLWVFHQVKARVPGRMEVEGAAVHTEAWGVCH